MGFSGRKLTDFCAGAGAIALGYSDPDVNRAVQRRVATGSYCQLLSPDEKVLGDLLLQLHPWAGKVRYARGGGDAMGVAVRIARAATGKSGIAFCGYHGWQDWYLAANLGDQAALDGHLLLGLVPLGVPRELRGTSVPFRYNDLASLDAALSQLDGRLAAVVMEPMRTQHPQDGFLERVKQRCRERGAVLIFDEITSGWRFGFLSTGAALFMMFTHTSAMVQDYLSALDETLGELDPLIAEGRLKAEAGNMATIRNFARLT